MTVQPENVYILITQCLQNGFFLADGGRLCLPRDVAQRMLVGGQPDVVSNESLLTIDKQNRRHFKNVSKGPLYRFFESLTGPSVNRQHPIHVINVRDWHAPSSHYDDERHLYGSHCEAESWEAEPIEGYEKFLKPWGEDKLQLKQAQSLDGLVCVRSDNNLVAVPERAGTDRRAGDVVYYDVRSDSVFDMKAPASTELKDLTDSLRLNSSDKEQATTSHLQLVLDQLIFDHRQKHPNARVYVVVIGAYTDIKVKTLLVGLRTRYSIEGLFVSDVLTDSPTLERHLAGLDFADKVLRAQIVHNLNDLVSVLNPGAKDIIHDKIIETTVDFRDYANYFLDRQNVLAFQDQRLLKYMELTSVRSAEVYKQIFDANWYLLRIGYLFLAAMVLLVFLRTLGLNIPDSLILSTAGLSAAQILTSFFAIPFAQLRSNVNALVRLRNYLETYSSVTGLLRYHLTKAERLQPKLADPHYRPQALFELELLNRQLNIIYTAADRMSETFRDLVPDDRKDKAEGKPGEQHPNNEQPASPPPPTPPPAPPITPGDGSVG